MTTNKTKQLTAQQLAIKLQKMNCTIQNHVSRGGGFASARWVGFSVRLEEMKENNGSFHAEKAGTFISFFVNHGSDKTSKFTYEGSTSCAPTYGMSLKAALEA